MSLQKKVDYKKVNYESKNSENIKTLIFNYMTIYRMNIILFV